MSQIRQNTPPVRASAMNSSVAQVGDVRRDLYAESEMAENDRQEFEDTFRLEIEAILRADG